MAGPAAGPALALRGRPRSVSPSGSTVADAQDPFRILSVPYDADAGDVRRAFRELARQTHPDRGGSAVRFHAVRLAYDALVRDLEGERRRWHPVPAAASRGRRYAAGLDPRVYPTCPVRLGRTRSGERTVAYDLSARPDAWAPGQTPPPAGECVLRVAATETTAACGVWVVPLDAHRFRCVFGPHP